MPKKIIKSFIPFILASCMSQPLYAVAEGMYLGLQGGPSTNDSPEQQVAAASPPYAPVATTIAKPKSNQFASRIYIGYQIGRYAGVEGGFTFYSPIQYTSNLEPENELRSRVRDIDVMGKGILPFGPFNAFVKAGVAATYITLAGGFNSDGKNKYEAKARPVFGLGAAYDLSQNWVVDVTWTRLMAGGQVKNLDALMLGFSYHFVDKYCGQFLCDD